MLACSMPAFGRYWQINGTEQQITSCIIVKNAVDSDYDCVCGKGIFSGLLCIICLMRPIQMYCFSAEPYAQSRRGGQEEAPGH